MRKTFQWAVVAIFALTTSAAAAPQKSNDDDVVGAYRSTKHDLDALIGHSAGGLQGYQEVGHPASVLAEQLELLERQWTINYLNEHKSLSKSDFDAALRQLDSGEINSVRLGDDMYLIFDIVKGGVFLAAVKNGRYRAVWDSGATIENMLQCEFSGGDMPAMFGSLPDTADGDHRFYVAATNCWITSIGHGFQLTIYRWHNTTATQEFIKSYDYYAESAVPHLRGKILHIVAEGEDRSFGGGACCRPMLDWRILLRPNGVEDLGRAPLDRERDVVDRLFDKIDRGKSANDLATAHVIARLKASIADLQKRPNGALLLGPLGGWEVKRGPRRAIACLSTDAEYFAKPDSTKSRNYQFAITYPGGRPYVSAVKILAENVNCGQ